MGGLTVDGSGVSASHGGGLARLRARLEGAVPAALRERVAAQLEAPPDILLAEFGQPRKLLYRSSRLPLVGPLRPRTWKSPLRGPWITSVFAIVLLVGFPIVIVTGLLSYIAYQPQFHQAIPANVGVLHLPYFLWPTHPAWLYRATQGAHVGLGIALIPIVLGKLWSVIPKLFAWPPVKSVAEVLDRISLALLVGSILFELATGVLNTQYDYIFKFDFYTAHYFGAWVFIAAFVVHVFTRLPKMRAGLKARSLRAELRTDLAHTTPEPYDIAGLVAKEPNAPTITRRGVLGIVFGGSLALTVVTFGATLSDRLRWTAIFSPRGETYGSGPGYFQVNRTARNAHINPADTGPAWRLQVVGPSGKTVQLSRTELESLPQHDEHLPIACVEGWSTVQRWTGVRLVDLAALVGASRPQTAIVQSLETNGPFGRVTLGSPQIRDHRSLLALKAAGVDLLPDHGYPARVIVPALPGVHNTKWVTSITFHGGH